MPARTSQLQTCMQGDCLEADCQWSLPATPQANNAPTLAMRYDARAGHLQGAGIGLAALQVLAALG